MVVVKLSSFGKSREAEIRNLKYIDRYGTLCDEMSQPITLDEALTKFDFGRRTTSYRIVISLPLAETERAHYLAQEILADRYQSFVSAYHQRNRDGRLQPHLHVNIQGHAKHPLRNMKEIFFYVNKLMKRLKRMTCPSGREIH